MIRVEVTPDSREITLKMNAGDFDALKRDVLFAEQFFKDMRESGQFSELIYGGYEKDNRLTKKELDRCLEVIRETWTLPTEHRASQ